MLARRCWRDLRCSGDAAAQHRRALRRVLYWESSLGGSYSQLFFEQAGDRPFWLAELMAQTGIVVRAPDGEISLWLNFAFHFPLIGRPGAENPAPASGRYQDPQTRVNVHLGILIAVTPAVDLFMEGSVLDRGDLEDPATTLPIAHGGFDQRQLIFGFIRRFGRD